MDTIQKNIDHIAQGKMVIVVDDEDRENEGDICISAENITADSINFMAKYARGLICLAMSEKRLKKLDLPMMVTKNNSKNDTAFTVSIEATKGVTTGISAKDRAHTIRTAVLDDAKPQDLVSPGHVFPLRARSGGVLVRSGHTEAAIDLMKIAGLKSCAVICEIMNDDGTMARMKDLKKFATIHDLPIITIADLIQYRVSHESLVHCLCSEEFNHSKWGKLQIYSFGSTLNTRQHLVVTMGSIRTYDPPLVRVHPGYPLNDIFDDIFDENHSLLHATMEKIYAEKRGVLVCLDQGQSPISLADRIKILGKGEKPPPFSPPSNTQRQIGIGAQILRFLGLGNIRLLMNSKRRLAGLEGYGLKVIETVPLFSTK